MNGFTKKSVGTLTLGERLRMFRADRRISLSDVSRGTKIQVKYLEFLESGEYEKLPADVYVKGFLKSYADFLGMEEKTLLKIYEKEKGIQKNLKKEKDINKNIKPLNISYFVFTPQKIALTLTVILAVVVIFFIYRQVGSFSSAPRLVVISPEVNTETTEKSLTVEGITEKDARVFINDQLVLANEDGKFKENIVLQKGANAITVKAINKFDKEAVETLNVQANFEDSVGEVLGENAWSLEKEISLEIRVNNGPVWISVEADGNLAYSGNLPSGATQTFLAKDKIVLESGQANETFVKLNGADLGALGKNPASIKGIVFDKNTTSINLSAPGVEIKPIAPLVDATPAPEKKKSKK